MGLKYSEFNEDLYPNTSNMEWLKKFADRFQTAALTPEQIDAPLKGSQEENESKIELNKDNPTTTIPIAQNKTKEQLKQETESLLNQAEKGVSRLSIEKSNFQKQVGSENVRNLATKIIQNANIPDTIKNYLNAIQKTIDTFEGTLSDNLVVRR